MKEDKKTEDRVERECSVQGEKTGEGGRLTELPDKISDNTYRNGEHQTPSADFVRWRKLQPEHIWRKECGKEGGDHFARREKRGGTKYVESSGGR